MTDTDPGWRIRGIRSLSEALECVVEGEGQIWAHKDDAKFNALKTRGLVTYKPGRGMDSKELEHGHWIATEAGIARHAVQKNRPAS